MMWQGWKFPSTSQKRILLYYKNIPSRSLSTQYHNLLAELYYSVKLFDEKLYKWETCRKPLHKNETPCESDCSKIAQDPIPDRLKDLQKLQKV